jgi:hypothetical protein
LSWVSINLTGSTHNSKLAKYNCEPYLQIGKRASIDLNSVGKDFKSVAEERRASGRFHFADSFGKGELTNVTGSSHYHKS